MTARGTAARIVRMHRELGQRDRAVLASLRRVRLLTTDHIARLHCTDLSDHTRARRARALVRHLTEQRLIVRLPRVIGGIRAGSRGHVYTLSGLGHAVLDHDADGSGSARPTRTAKRHTVWHTKPYFQDHMLAVADLYVRLVEQCRATDAELLAFDAEPACWRRFPGIGGQTVVLKPDAYVRVGTKHYELAAFVEVDLGTESLPTIQRKCQVFTAYWRSGLEQQRQGVFPRVVWLVPTDHRLAGVTAALRRLGQRSGDRSHGLFTVTLTEYGPQLLTTPPSEPSTEVGDAS